MTWSTDLLQKRNFFKPTIFCFKILTLIIANEELDIKMQNVQDSLHKIQQRIHFLSNEFRLTLFLISIKSAGVISFSTLQRKSHTSILYCLLAPLLSIMWVPPLLPAVWPMARETAKQYNDHCLAKSLKTEFYAFENLLGKMLE